MLHNNSAIERFTLPRREGGRGCIDIENLHLKQIKKLRECFYSRQDSELHKAIIKSDTKATPLQLSDDNYDPTDNKK